MSCGLRDVVGFEESGRPGVLVPHPVQDRTDDELRAMARGAVDDVVRAIS